MALRLALIALGLASVLLTDIGKAIDCMGNPADTSLRVGHVVASAVVWPCLMGWYFTWG